jgi:hypothetical protein
MMIPWPKPSKWGPLLLELKQETLGIKCIRDMLHMPKLRANLLSVSKYLSNGLKMQVLMNEYIVGGANGDVVVIT